MALVQPKGRLEQAFLDCHADGHQWKHHTEVVDPVDAESGLRPPWNASSARGRRSTCASCGGERIRWYTFSGEVVNRYRMKDGYYHKRSAPDDFAPSRLDYRKQLVITLFDDVKPAKRRLASAS